jgi:hypothetical protein
MWGALLPLTSFVEMTPSRLSKGLADQILRMGAEIWLDGSRQ